MIGPLSLARFIDWFQFLLPDPDWIPDEVCGMPMEHSRWVIMAFWICILLSLILIVDEKTEYFEFSYQDVGATKY